MKRSLGIYCRFEQAHDADDIMQINKDSGLNRDKRPTGLQNQFTDYSYNLEGEASSNVFKVTGTTFSL